MSKQFVIEDLEDLKSAIEQISQHVPDDTTIEFWHRSTGADENPIIIELHDDFDDETVISLRVE